MNRWALRGYHARLDEHILDHAEHAGGGFWENLSNAFSQVAFMPHGHCYLWQPPLVWSHVVTDLLIGFAYLSISLSLYALIKKIRVPFSAMVLAFGVFIGACGATHFMEVWNLWNAAYWTGAFVKVITAVASVATCVWLIKIKPQIVSVANAAKVSEQRREALELMNEELKQKRDELFATNQVLAEQQKRLAHAAKMSALGEMAGGIAHEINSPLAIVTVRANQLERLQARGQLTPEAVTQEAQLIAKTAKRIGDIIKGLRAFAREGSDDPLETASVAELVDDALVLCQTRFKNNNVSLKIDVIDKGLHIECRAVQITQVVLNLLANAYDAVAKLDERWVSLQVLDRGDSVELTVTDSGHGIDEDIQAKIMQPFFTTKGVGRGTGLGLSISKGIVEAHQGKLELDATAPNTKFVLTLPKQPKREPSA